MNLGNLIRQKRKEMKLSQTDVAEKIGVSTNTISKYERNIISNIGRKKILALSKLLDIPTIYFLDSFDNPNLDLDNIQSEEITRSDFIDNVKSLLDKANFLSDIDKEYYLLLLKKIEEDSPTNNE